MIELIARKATKAFNAVGARKADGTLYLSVQGHSVSADRRRFRFWEEDVIRENDRTLEVRCRPRVRPEWLNSINGSAFFQALVAARVTGSQIYGTINRRGRPHGDGTSNAIAAAPILTKSDIPAPGTVLSANAKTGCFHVRFELNDALSEYVDQRTVLEVDGKQSKNLRITYSRNEKVRELVLRRAGGACEGCGEKGFKTQGKKLYLETHHIVHRSVNGPDSTSNVVAVCANCHRKAHWSAERLTLIAHLLTKCSHVT